MQYMYMYNAVVPTTNNIILLLSFLLLSFVSSIWLLVLFFLHLMMKSLRSINECYSLSYSTLL